MWLHDDKTNKKRSISSSTRRITIKLGRVLTKCVEFLPINQYDPFVAIKNEV